MLGHCFDKQSVKLHPYIFELFKVESLVYTKVFEPLSSCNFYTLLMNYFQDALLLTRFRLATSILCHSIAAVLSCGVSDSVYMYVLAVPIWLIGIFRVRCNAISHFFMRLKMTF